MKDAHPFMPTRAEGRDPNLCAAPDCGQVWNSIKHQPSLYLDALGPYRAAVSDAVRRLSEGAGVPPALLHTERASGAPSDAAPATHTGRPSSHSGQPGLRGVLRDMVVRANYIPTEARVMMCPKAGAHVQSGKQSCQFGGTTLRSDLYKHIKHDHGWREDKVNEYIAYPWFADEPRADWKDRRARREVPFTVTMGKPGRGKTLINPAQSIQADLMRDLQRVAEVQDSIVFEIPGPDLEYNGHAQPKCPKTGCSTVNRHRHSRAEMGADALAKLGGQPIKRNGVTTEFHKCDATDAHFPHLWQPGAKTEWFTCRGDLLPDEADICEHPNGFGVYGCPCGAVRNGEDDEPTFRNLDTGEDEPIVKCPVTIDCAYGRWAASQLRRHLQVDHQWTGEQYESWAESVSFPDDPVISGPLDNEPTDTGDFFYNPVNVEDLMAADDQNRGLEAVLTEWWLKRAEREANEVVPKAVEYGSNSLMQVGRKMAQLQGRTVADDEALELGCWSYAIGKVERWTDAVMRGERPSDDTLHDIGVYIKMAQRIRDAGSWPGV